MVLRARSSLSAIISLACLLQLGCARFEAPAELGTTVLGTADAESARNAENAGQLGNKETMTEAFALARTVLYGEAAVESPRTGALPGLRVFLCAYQDEPVQRCATGAGDNLSASIRNAASALAKAEPKTVNAARKAGIRLKMDVATRAQDSVFRRSIDKPKKRKVARYGYWVQSGTQVSWILPSEILELGLYSDKRGKKGIPRKNVVKALARRNPSLGQLDEEFEHQQIHTVAWLEQLTEGDEAPGIVQLYRTHLWDFDSVDPDRLLQRTVWAADYLISSISADGKIRYRYYPSRDRDSNSYNLLRHGGTTYSILQAYDRTKFEPYLTASKKAIDYLFARCRRDVRKGPYGGGDVMYVLEGRTIKLGGSGLGLVMLDQYAEATGDHTTYLDEARAFARFLVSQQKEDGEFVYFAPLKPGDPPSTDTSAYYPGEAILGLVRLYSWDRNPLWLDTAVRGADWLIQVRDQGKDEKRLANDHWLMIALSYLYNYTKREDYLDHSLALARAVEYQYQKNMKSAKVYRDYRGGYYDPPRSTPAATRGEGLVAVLDTCSVAGKRCEWVEELLHETVRHEMLSQYDPDTTYWMSNKKKSFGGWNGGLIDPSVRNDFVQHNMSSILGAERHLRKKQGIALPGGPEWTNSNLEQGLTWPGVEQQQMTKLRAATLKFRGTTDWEVPPR
ncbi:MAG: hypothetical protein CMP23_13140 [Rickettsiales bacterium]|nr:hypothetical protein [Rickettsiales bacterium]